MGSLLRGGTGIITFAVTNTGTTVAKTVTAAVTLPAGVSYLSGGTLGMDGMGAAATPGGWSCRAVPAGAQCTHGPLGPGASASSYLRVAIAADAPLGTPPGIVAGVGGSRVSARGESGVIAAGLPARFAAAGRNAVLSTGNAFPECGWWTNVIPGWCRNRASSARLSLPGRVRWAGLYWSWVGTRPSAAIELSGPGAGPQQISADDTGTDASLGEPVHQAFADVTSLVRQDGAGVWRAAVPDGGPGSEPPAGGSGWGRYGGWALVVVAADPAVPAGRVMVLDGTHVVRPDSPYSVPVDGLTAGHEAGVLEATWRGPNGGPAFGTVRQAMPSPARVTLAVGPQPYLVGVVAVSDPAAGILPPGRAVPPGRILPPRPDRGTAQRGRRQAGEHTTEPSNKERATKELRRNEHGTNAQHGTGPQGGAARPPAPSAHLEHVAHVAHLAHRARREHPGHPGQVNGPA